MLIFFLDKRLLNELRWSSFCFKLSAMNSSLLFLLNKERESERDMWHIKENSGTIPHLEFDSIKDRHSFFDGLFLKY